MNQLIINTTYTKTLYDIIKIMLIGRYGLHDSNFRDIVNGYVVDLNQHGSEDDEIIISYKKIECEDDITVNIMIIGKSAINVMMVYDDIEEITCESC